MTDLKCPTCGVALLEHPANRCLDAWVAEKVMGWAYDSLLGLIPPQDNGLPPTTPHYSSDISAAWGVVEKMEGDWWKMEFLTGIHAAMFEKPNMKCADQTYHEATADTMPLAICRASLLAVLG